MGAAADGLAMGVEDHHLDIRQPGVGERPRELDPETFNGKRCCDLPHETARIGKPGLHAQALPGLDVGPVMLVLDELRDHVVAMFERVRRLEQGRNVQPVGNPEQAREIQGGENLERRFTLGNQQPDGGFGIDMLEDLRGNHEQAPRRGRFRDDIAEVTGDWRCVGDQLVQGAHVGTPRGRHFW